MAANSTFPSCGCEACDADPAEEIERLTELVADVVAGGCTGTRRPRILRMDQHERVLRYRDEAPDVATDRHPA